MKVYIYRSGFAFFPAYSSDSDLMSKFREGEVIEVDAKKARNHKNHRRFFALLKLGYDAQTLFDSFEWWREYILIKSGNFESCQSPTGVMYRAKSISFASMDELEFRELYKSVSQAIIDTCGITENEIENNLNLFT